MKVVISECHGGFGLSGAAKELMLTLGWEGGYDRDIPRNDPLLIQVVEELGAAANSSYATLVVIEVPDDVEWHVHEYDGFETLHENHRSWGSEGEEVNCGT